MGGHDNYPRVEEGFAVGLRGVGNKNTPWQRQSSARYGSHHSVLGNHTSSYIAVALLPGPGPLSQQAAFTQFHLAASG